MFKLTVYRGEDFEVYKTINVELKLSRLNSKDTVTEIDVQNDEYELVSELRLSKISRFLNLQILTLDSHVIQDCESLYQKMPDLRTLSCFSVNAKRGEVIRHENVVSFHCDWPGRKLKFDLPNCVYIRANIASDTHTENSESFLFIDSPKGVETANIGQYFETSNAIAYGTDNSVDDTIIGMIYVNCESLKVLRCGHLAASFKMLNSTKIRTIYATSFDHALVEGFKGEVKSYKSNTFEAPGIILEQYRREVA